MDFLFGAEMPLAVRFFIAFVVVLALIGGTAYLVRRFGGDRLGSASGRGRQPRLAVIDAAAVDGRRRLVLIRRDNVEHLLMIGGPTDVVIEPNIVRAAAAPRDMQQARPQMAPMEAMPRPVPVAEGNLWPLQPEPASPAPPPFSPRLRPVSEESADWRGEPEPLPLPPRPSRPEPRPADPLAGLAAELSRQPAAPEPSAPKLRIPREMPSRHEIQPEVRREPQRERPGPVQQVPAAEEHAVPSTDQNLAEMAQRLEAALRRPKAAAARQGGPTPRPQPERPSAAPESSNGHNGNGHVGEDHHNRSHAETAPDNVAAAARADASPIPSRSVYDSLEQEMASLLGRPNEKT